jgi:uncharacterized peroxidase-related enzyme
VHHHAAGLLALTRDDQLVAAISKDYRTAPLGDAERAMLDYAVKLTRTPSKVSQGDVDLLRQAGFSEAAVLDICQVAAYFNFVNRLADGLGVELETERQGQQSDG